MSNRYPSQRQLLFPLLECLADLGESAPRDVYPAVAEAVGLPATVREDRTPGGVRAWDRHLRFAELQAQQRGLTAHPRRNRWRATDRAAELLGVAEPGVLQVIFRTAQGEVLWADALNVLRGWEPRSVDLFMLSPPYLLQRQKAYGGPNSEREYLEWFLPFASEMYRTLRESGTMAINLAPGPYLPGLPVRSAYVHRLVLALLETLNFFLVGEHIWHNPAALPAPAEWVTKKKIQPKDGFEVTLVFSRTPAFKADTRRVRVPYSPAQQRLMKRGWEKTTRPSGHALTGNMARDNGGALPSRVLVAANTASNDAYQRYCRAHDLPIHPARYPEALPEFFIQWLTEPGDLVVDPFAGSLTTGAVAERLGRRWIGIERCKTYVDGGIGRFSA